MKVFTVHEPPDAGPNRLEDIALVKEGFCWPALFIPALWMLWHRMWWVLLGWLVIGVGLAAVGEIFAPTGFIVGTLSLAFAVWFALEANELRRWSLARKGWRLLGVAIGRTREEAERLYFRRALAPPTATGQRARLARAPETQRRADAGSEPVVGLFPQPD